MDWCLYDNGLRHERVKSYDKIPNHKTKKTKHEVKNTSHGCDVRIVFKDIYNLFFKIALRSQETEKMCSWTSMLK